MFRKRVIASSMAATLVVGVALFVSACGIVGHTSHVDALTGELTSMQGAPRGEQFVRFVGRWVNEGGNAVTFFSTTPALLRTTRRTIYPWQYRSEMRSEFEKQCHIDHGKKVCVKPKPTSVTVAPGSAFKWNVTFSVPKRMCHAVVTVHIKGLPGAMHGRVPCNS